MAEKSLSTGCTVFHIIYSWVLPVYGSLHLEPEWLQDVAREILLTYIVYIININLFFFLSIKYIFKLNAQLLRPMVGSKGIVKSHILRNTCYFIQVNFNVLYIICNTPVSSPYFTSIILLLLLGNIKRTRFRSYCKLFILFFSCDIMCQSATSHPHKTI